MRKDKLETARTLLRHLGRSIQYRIENNDDNFYRKRKGSAAEINRLRIELNNYLIEITK